MNHQERAEALEREIAEWREENAAQASEIVRLAAALERASAEQSERAMQAIDVFGACLLANAHDLAIVQHNVRVLRRRM